jgi:hypothetical protein
MRVMTLLDTGCLASLLLFALVLPLMLSVSGSKQLALPRSAKRTVWLGQALLGIAGVVVLASGLAAPVAALFGALSCGACAVMLHRQFRAGSAC